MAPHPTPPYTPTAYFRRGRSYRTLTGDSKFAISLQGRGSWERGACHQGALICPFSRNSKQRY